MKVIHQCMQSRFAKRHDPLLLSLTCHTNKLFAKIYVLQIDVDELANTDAGCIQKFDDRAIPAPEIRIDVGRFNKANCVIDRKMIGEFSFYLWRCDELCRVAFNNTLTNEELKKRA